MNPYIMIATKEASTSVILKNLIGFLSPLVGVALILYCVFQAFKIFKGAENASIGKMIGGIVIFLFLLGVMFAAGSLETWGNIFKDLVGNGIEKGAGSVTDILGE